jgi:hypothetical protein
MSQSIQSYPLSLIEDFVGGLPPKSQDSARTFLRDIVMNNLTALSPGGNLLMPNGAPSGGSKAPSGVTHSTVGANGVYTVAINNPPTVQGTPIYHEVSYSPLKSFTKSVTTLPMTTATNIQIPAVGVNNFVRLRSSFDGKTWSNYQLSSTEPINAGYVESSAMAPGAAFNQSNFALVAAPSSGSGAVVSISGPSSALTPYTAVKGTTQSLRPSATIVGAFLGPNEFVGYDGQSYQLRATLADVLADNLEPVGKVTFGTSEVGGGGTGGGNGARLTNV